MAKPQRTPGIINADGVAQVVQGAGVLQRLQIGRYCQRKRLNLSAPPRGFGHQPRCGLQRVQILDDRQRLRDPEFTIDQQRHATLRVERTIRFGKLLAAVPEEMDRSEEHKSELQSIMRISYAVFFLKKK